MNRKAFFLWPLLLFFMLLIVGCEKEKSSISQPLVNENKKVEINSPILTVEDIKENLPIPIEEGKFEKVYGWMDGQTIVYSTNIQNHSNVYAYNLAEGKNRLIKKLESSITALHISPSGEYLLIRSPFSPTEMLISIIQKSGEELYSEKIEAFDVAIEWNPYNEQRVLISTFTEDWQSQSFDLSLADKKRTEIKLSNPFSYWYDENRLIYLNWNQNDVSLFANVFTKDLLSEVEKEVLSSIFHMDTFKRSIMTIKIDQDSMSEASYYFYDQELNSIGSFKTPTLTRFSDWLIPYYDFNEKENTFISFQPIQNGEVSTYNQGFQLFKYELNHNEKKSIMEGLENEPLSCSSEGDLCLYGYYFEKLIDLDRKIVLKLSA
jgi:YqgU-like 6-bladed beta propeller domain